MVMLTCSIHSIRRPILVMSETKVLIVPSYLNYNLRGLRYNVVELLSNSERRSSNIRRITNMLFC